MQYFKIITIIIFILSVIIYSISNFIYKNPKNDNNPKIISDKKILEISTTEHNNHLLDGLKAYDKDYCDITDRIIVLNESYFLTPKECNVNYAVFDDNNNFALFKRKVRYKDYEHPRFVLKKPLNYSVGSSVHITKDIEAWDCIDGNISSKIRLISGDIKNMTEGIYRIKIEVTNTHGDKSSAELNVNVSEKKIKPDIELNDYIIYIKKGEKFDPYSVIKNVYDYENSVDYDDIIITGAVNTDNAGCYTLVYSLSDNDEVCKNTYLSVVVEEDF